MRRKLWPGNVFGKLHAKARARPGLTLRRDESVKGSEGQATLLSALLMPLLIGSAVSVATFCASVPSSLLCLVSVSNCLRLWALDNSMTSDSDLAVIISLKKS